MSKKYVYIGGSGVGCPVDPADKIEWDGWDNGLVVGGVYELHESY